MNLIKEQGLTIVQVAKELDVSTAQIYQWNKKGISIKNKHYKKLKTLIPKLKPKETTLTKTGEEDQRFKAGRNKKSLELLDADTTPNTEKDFESTLFPKIMIRNKTT